MFIFVQFILYAPITHLANLLILFHGENAHIYHASRKYLERGQIMGKYLRSSSEIGLGIGDQDPSFANPPLFLSSFIITNENLLRFQDICQLWRRPDDLFLHFLTIAAVHLSTYFYWLLKKIHIWFNHQVYN